MGNIVILKRLDSRGFHDLFNQYIFSFHKRYEYYKTGAYDINANISRIFEKRSLDNFNKCKKSMGLYNGKNPKFDFEVVMTNIRSTGNLFLKEQRLLK